MQDAAAREAWLARLQLELGERSGQILLPKGTKTPNAWPLDSWLPESRDRRFLLFAAPLPPCLGSSVKTDTRHLYSHRGLLSMHKTLPSTVPVFYYLQLFFRRRQWRPLQYSCLENPMDGGAL